MADPIKVHVGPSLQADGCESQARGTKTGELCVAVVHGRYYESVSRGTCWLATTGTGGVAPGTSIGTTPAFLLYNPRGSGKRLVIQRVVASYISGSLGAGTLFYCVNTNTYAAAPTGGSSLTPVNLDIGSNLPCVAVANTGGTLPATPTVLRPFCSLTALTASTAVAPFQTEEEVDGEIVLEPGTALSLQAVAASGSTPLIAIAVSWEEVPIV